MNRSIRSSARLIALFIVLALTRTLLPTGTAVAAESPCPNEVLRTGTGANLPDCRAYEQASPADKNGGQVEGFPAFFTASEDGSAISFFGTAGTAIATSGGSTGSYPEYLSTRRGDEWTTQRATAPQSPLGPGEFSQGTNYLGLTPDGKLAVATAIGARCGTQVCSSLWAIDTQTETPTMIAQASGSAARFKYGFDGASQDGARVFFETKSRLLPGAVEGVPNLYMWERSTGGLFLVDVLPGQSEAPEGGAFGGPYNWPEGEVSAGGVFAGLAVGASHAISPSGNQIFFTVPEGTGELGEFESGQLFLRRGLSGGLPSTIRISEPNEGVTNPNAAVKPAAFQEATPDGSHAFFTSAAKLTANATTGPTEEGNDLYRWDAGSNELIDVTPDTGDENGAQVKGLLGANEVGTAGFVVALGVLAKGGTAGGWNIYRFEETSPGAFTYSFVALLNENTLWDERNWIPRPASPYSGEFFSIGEEQRASRVNSTADTLLFTSVAELTSFHNAGTACELISSGPRNSSGEVLCNEIYRYSAAEGKVVCVSCNPSGRVLGGNVRLQPEEVPSSGHQGPKVGAAAPYSRNLSSNGRRAFFQTTEPLAPGDVNGGEGCAERRCADVYEWEAPGEGSCVATSSAYSPQDAGCVYLISPGQSPAPTEQASYFLDASLNGDDVFIATNNPLLPSDGDEVFDAYDASVAGGLLSQHAGPPSGCLGEECQGPASEIPPAVGAGSGSVVGPGNRKNRVKVIPCAKPHGKKKSKASKSCKRHSHRGSSKRHKGHRKSNNRKAGRGK